MVVAEFVHGLTKLLKFLSEKVQKPHRIADEKTVRNVNSRHELINGILQNVNADIADLTTRKHRLQMQKDRLEDQIDTHDEQMQAAADQGREDLVARAEEKKRAKHSAIEDVNENIVILNEREERLLEMKGALEQRITQSRIEEPLRTEEDVGLPDGIEEFGTGYDRIQIALRRVDEIEERVDSPDHIGAILASE